MIHVESTYQTPTSWKRSTSSASSYDPTRLAKEISGSLLIVLSCGGASAVPRSGSTRSSTVRSIATHDYKSERALTLLLELERAIAS